MSKKPQAETPWLSDDAARRFNDAVSSWAGRATGGLPLPRIVQAYIDWAINLGGSPGRQLQILEKLVRSRASLLAGLLRKPGPLDDPRFSGEGWQRRPYAWLAQAALHREALVKLATDPLPGMDRHNAELVRFYTAQLAEALSPANFPLTNPDWLRITREQRGRNLLRGARHALQDTVQRLRPPAEDAAFKVGRDLAATPGKVIHRNSLMELIQYSPTTETVHPEPILIIPAWIMKYYILDLSAHNSLVKWLVSQGHTVFMVSWKNPVAEDRNIGMDDYRRLGVMAALDAVNAVLPKRKVHTVGYCVGGTLLSITAATMARDGDNRLKSITLFAAQTDFTEAGELRLFIDEAALYWLDRQMARKGYLDTKQMGGAFALLRSRDLLWAPMLRRYAFGESNAAFDIMAWNADGTRMPYRMHSDYLRQLYLNNQFAQGQYIVDGRAVSMGDVKAPLFVVGTSTDHVAPWRSVYKLRNLKRLGETTFVLTNGGHNAGIVSEPGRPRRRYQIGKWAQSTAYQSADDWAADAERRDGSWWPAWQQWLASHSSEPGAPPGIGAPEQHYDVLGDAPGTYVFQR